MALWKFLHIACAFAAISISFGPQLLVWLVAARRSPRELAGAAAAATRLGPFIGILFILTGIFGVLTIFLGPADFDPLAAWLVIAYILFLVGLGIGSFITGPWIGRIAQAAAANTQDTPDSELVAVLTDPLPRVAMWVNLLVIVLLVADMVFKPFGG